MEITFGMASHCIYGDAIIYVLYYYFLVTLNVTGPRVFCGGSWLDVVLRSVYWNACDIFSPHYSGTTAKPIGIYYCYRSVYYLCICWDVDRRPTVCNHYLGDHYWTCLGGNH